RPRAALSRWCPWPSLGPDRLVRETRLAQLRYRPIGLREPLKPHALEDPLRLRELHVPVVDDLEVISPGIEEVVIPDHLRPGFACGSERRRPVDRKSTRLNSSHVEISYAVFCLKKKKNIKMRCSIPSEASRRSI